MKEDEIRHILRFLEDTLTEAFREDTLTEAFWTWYTDDYIFPFDDTYIAYSRELWNTL